MFLCFKEVRIFTSMVKLFHVSSDDFDIFTATRFPSGRSPLYTRLLAPFASKFSATKSHVFKKRFFRNPKLVNSQVKYSN